VGGGAWAAAFTLRENGTPAGVSSRLLAASPLHRASSFPPQPSPLVLGVRREGRQQLALRSLCGSGARGSNRPRILRETLSSIAPPRNQVPIHGSGSPCVGRPPRGARRPARRGALGCGRGAGSSPCSRYRHCAGPHIDTVLASLSYACAAQAGGPAPMIPLSGTGGDAWDRKIASAPRRHPPQASPAGIPRHRRAHAGPDDHVHPPHGRIGERGPGSVVPIPARSSMLAL